MSSNSLSERVNAMQQQNTGKSAKYQQEPTLYTPGRSRSSASTVRPAERVVSRVNRSIGSTQPQDDYHVRNRYFGGESGAGNMSLMADSVDPALYMSESSTSFQRAKRAYIESKKRRETLQNSLFHTAANSLSPNAQGRFRVAYTDLAPEDSHGNPQIASTQRSSREVVAGDLAMYTPIQSIKHRRLAEEESFVAADPAVWEDSKQLLLQRYQNQQYMKNHGIDPQITITNLRKELETVHEQNKESEQRLRLEYEDHLQSKESLLDQTVAALETKEMQSLTVLENEWQDKFHGLERAKNGEQAQVTARLEREKEELRNTYISEKIQLDDRRIQEQRDQEIRYLHDKERQRELFETELQRKQQETVAMKSDLLKALQHERDSKLTEKMELMNVVEAQQRDIQTVNNNLSDQHASYEREIDQLKQAHVNEKQALLQELRTEVAQLTSKYQNEASALQQQLVQQSMDSNERLSRELAKLQAQYEAEQQRLRTQGEEEHAKHEREVEMQRMQFDHQISSIQKDHEKAVLGMQKDHELQVCMLENRIEKERVSGVQALEDEKDYMRLQLEQDTNSIVREMKQQHEHSVNELQKKQALQTSDLANTKKIMAALEQSKDRTMREFEAVHENARTQSLEHAREVETLRQNYGFQLQTAKQDLIREKEHEVSKMQHTLTATETKFQLQISDQENKLRDITRNCDRYRVELNKLERETEMDSVHKKSHVTELTGKIVRLEEDKAAQERTIKLNGNDLDKQKHELEQRSLQLSMKEQFAKNQETQLQSKVSNLERDAMQSQHSIQDSKREMQSLHDMINRQKRENTASEQQVQLLQTRLAEAEEKSKVQLARITDLSVRVETNGTGDHILQNKQERSVRDIHQMQEELLKRDQQLKQKQHDLDLEREKMLLKEDQWRKIESKIQSDANEKALLKEDQWKRTEAKWHSDANEKAALKEEQWKKIEAKWQIDYNEQATLKENQWKKLEAKLSSDLQDKQREITKLTLDLQKSKEDYFLLQQASQKSMQQVQHQVEQDSIRRSDDMERYMLLFQQQDEKLQKQQEKLVNEQKAQQEQVQQQQRREPLQEKLQERLIVEIEKVRKEQEKQHEEKAQLYRDFHNLKHELEKEKEESATKDRVHERALSAAKEQLLEKQVFDQFRKEAEMQQARDKFQLDKELQELKFKVQRDKEMNDFKTLRDKEMNDLAALRDKEMNELRLQKEKEMNELRMQSRIEAQTLRSPVKNSGTQYMSPTSAVYSPRPAKMHQTSLVHGNVPNPNYHYNNTADPLKPIPYVNNAPVPTLSSHKPSGSFPAAMAPLSTSNIPDFTSKQQSTLPAVAEHSPDHMLAYMFPDNSVQSVLQTRVQSTQHSPKASLPHLFNPGEVQSVIQTRRQSVVATPRVGNGVVDQLHSIFPPKATTIKNLISMMPLLVEPAAAPPQLHQPVPVETMLFDNLSDPVFRSMQNEFSSQPDSPRAANLPEESITEFSITPSDRTLSSTMSQSEPVVGVDLQGSYVLFDTSLIMEDSN